MKKRQIEKFVNRFSGKKKVGWVFDSEDVKNFFKGSRRFPSTILVLKHKELGFDAIIRLKDKFVKNKNDAEIKAVLLHELGHLHEGIKKTKRSENETEAHIWAIKTCTKYKMFSIMKVLVLYWISWSHENWKRNRIYRLAYKNIKNRIKLPKHINKLMNEFEKEKL